MRGAENGSGWRPLRELSLRKGDVIVFEYGDDFDPTVVKIETELKSGGLSIHQLANRFSSPEEVALEMEARGDPGRVLLLNFAPSYKEIEKSGDLLPFRVFGETDLEWREIR